MLSLATIAVLAIFVVIILFSAVRILREYERGVVFTILVKPGRALEKFSLNSSFELTLSIRAKSLENAANARAREAIAQIFSLPPSRVEILSGHRSRMKRILLHKVRLLDVCREGQP